MKTKSYDPKFVEKIRKSEKGQSHHIDIDSLWKSIKEAENGEIVTYNSFEDYVAAINSETEE